MDLIHITDDTFKKEVLESNIPIVIEFGALAWCQPCKLRKPILEKLSDEYKDQVKFCYLDIDDNTKTTGTYKIRSVPTLLFFKDGKVIKTQVGLTTRAVLKEFLDAWANDLLSFL